MRALGLISLVIVLPGTFNAVAVGQSTQPPRSTTSRITSKAPLSITIHPLLDVMKAGSPVKVRITVANNTKRQIFVETWGPDLLFQFDVRDSHGDRPLTARGRAVFSVEEPGSSKVRVDLPMGSNSSETVDPGKSLDIEQEIPDLFDLSQPGIYTIQVHRPDGLGSGGLVNSNTVRLTIVP